MSPTGTAAPEHGPRGRAHTAGRRAGLLCEVSQPRLAVTVVERRACTPPASCPWRSTRPRPGPRRRPTPCWNPSTRSAGPPKSSGRRRDRRAHASRVRRHGRRLRANVAACFLTSCPEMLPEHHGQHIAVELSNWINAAAAEAGEVEVAFYPHAPASRPSAITCRRAPHAGVDRPR